MRQPGSSLFLACTRVSQSVTCCCRHKCGSMVATSLPCPMYQHVDMIGVGHSQESWDSSLWPRVHAADDTLKISHHLEVQSSQIVQLILADFSQKVIAMTHSTCVTTTLLCRKKVETHPGSFSDTYTRLNP